MKKEDFFYVYQKRGEPTLEQSGTPESIIWGAERVISMQWDKLTEDTEPTREVVTQWVADVVSRFAPYNAGEIMAHYLSLREGSK